MLAGVFKQILGFLLLPLCFAMGRSAFLVITLLQAPVMECVALICGVAAFVFIWIYLPRPVRMYVLGHELTHALWGLLFFARPSKLRVRKNGGSVNLTKTNFLITLSPYFFPFYTFVLIVLAALTKLAVTPLPLVPLWLFLLGMSWAFHVLFTFDSLSCFQPDIAEYGRVLSWAFIFTANVAVVLLALASVVSVSLGEVVATVCSCSADAYVWVYSVFREAVIQLRQ